MRNRRPSANAKGRSFYVWFDAPIGYVSNLKRHLELLNSDEDYQKDWWTNKDVEISISLVKTIFIPLYYLPYDEYVTGEALPATQVPANQYLNYGHEILQIIWVSLDAAKAVKRFWL